MLGPIASRREPRYGDDAALELAPRRASLEDAARATPRRKAAPPPGPQLRSGSAACARASALPSRADCMHAVRYVAADWTVVGATGIAGGAVVRLLLGGGLLA